MSETILATRPATDADFDYVWTVYSEAVKPHIAHRLKNGWHNAIEAENFRRIWKASDSHIITVDEKPVGWVGVVISGQEVEIEHFYIDGAFRSKGVGTRLITELTKRWIQEGKTVKAEVLNDHRVAKFVSRLGFVAKDVETDRSLTSTFVYHPQ